MMRNKHGINLDLGVPLLSEEDFGILYVDLYPKQKQRLVDWINGKNEGPVIVAGQIGAGKTTLIEKAFQEAAERCDIKIALDTETPMYERGAFWGVFLGKVLDYARSLEIDVSGYNLPEDLLPETPRDNGMTALVNKLTEKPRSISDFNDKRKLYTQIDENIEFIEKTLADIIDKIEAKNRRKLFVFVEGIDKFNPHRAEFFSLVNLLNFLGRCKTLYEANFIHLLGDEAWHNNSKKVFLTGVINEQVIKVLMKRLGVYAASRETMIPVLARLSGGNVRQGIRLLMEYDYAANKEKKGIKDTLEDGAQRVRNDLLNILSDPIEPELLKVINRDRYITSGTLLDFSSREESQNAVYNNWILITAEPNGELKWPAIINPLLLTALDAYDSLPQSPETKMLEKWAEVHDASPFGLDIDISAVDGNKFRDIIASEITWEPALNIMEVFDGMAAYFLNPNRKDKIIIAYESKEPARLANDFIIGKATTYKTGNFKDITFDEIPEGRLDIYLSSVQGESIDGYSIFFEKKLDKKLLGALDQRRDAFIEYQMIWWLSFEDLKDYLKYWPQLRQFFKIFHLERDVLAGITKEELEEDLEDIELDDIADKTKDPLRARLKRVLDYLKSRR